MTAARFTCWTPDGFTTLKANSPREADEETKFESLLIIQDSRRAIGVRFIECGILRRGRAFREIRPTIKTEAICTIEIGGILRIANTFYRSKIKTGVTGDDFLAFSKNGVSFWAIEGDVVFVKVDGRRV